MASFEAGLTTREMISAMAKSRSRPGGPSNPGRPSARACAHTAATCPCGTDRVMVAAADAATNTSPANERRISSMVWLGRWDRLATVSFLTRPSSR